MSKKIIVPAFLIFLLMTFSPTVCWWVNGWFRVVTNEWIIDHVTEFQIVCAGLIIALIYFNVQHSSLFGKILLWLCILPGIYCMFLSFYLYSDSKEDGVIHCSNVEICSYAGILGLLVWWLVTITKHESHGIQPLRKPKEQLGRTYSYNSLEHYIRVQASDLAIEKNRRGCNIAIVGDWGCGKSHCISYLKYKLGPQEECKSDESALRNCGLAQKEKTKSKKQYEGNFIFCDVSLWKCKSVEDAWLNIVNALYKSIHKGQSFALTSFPGRLLSLFLKLASMCSIGGASTMCSLLEVVSSSVGSGVQDSISKIDAELAERRLILVLDDVERADFEILIRLFPLIDQLRKITRLTVICAISEDELVKIFKRNGINEDSLGGYLTKIFDYSYSMPPMSSVMVAEKIYNDYNHTGKDCEFLGRFLSKFNWMFDSPRQMERMLARWQGMERQYFSMPDEISKEYACTLHEEFELKVYIAFVFEAFRMYDKDLISNIRETADACGFFKASIKRENFSLRDGKSYEIYFIDRGTNEPKYKYKNKIVKSAICFILDNLEKIKNTHLMYALDMEYAKLRELNDYQCAAIIGSSGGVISSSLENELSVLFAGAKIEHDCVKSSTLALVSYAIRNIAESDVYVSYARYAVNKLGNEIIRDLCDYNSGEEAKVCILDSIYALYTPAISDKEADNSVQILSILLERLDITGLALSFERALRQLRERSNMVTMHEGVRRMHRTDDVCITSADKKLYLTFACRYVKAFTDMLASCTKNNGKIYSGIYGMLEQISTMGLHDDIYSEFSDNLIHHPQKEKVLKGALKVLHYSAWNGKKESQDLPPQMLTLYEYIIKEILGDSRMNSSLRSGYINGIRRLLSERKKKNVTQNTYRYTASSTNHTVRNIMMMIEVCMLQLENMSADAG